MKEILAQALRDDESDATNVVSTWAPSQVDGFFNGLNVLLYGRGGYYQLLQRSLSVETLLMVTADTRPKVLHLKLEHYLLLSTHNVPSDFGAIEFSSVECIIVHGSCALQQIDKEKLNVMFPNLQSHTFLEGEYFESYDSKASTYSDSSTVSRKSSTSSSSSNDDFL